MIRISERNYRDKYRELRGLLIEYHQISHKILKESKEEKNELYNDLKKCLIKSNAILYKNYYGGE
ncbi:MAG: hypothetical protein ACQEQF_04985 [Bacillota bacterium]